jgi:hypothetical protein
MLEGAPDAFRTRTRSARRQFRRVQRLAPRKGEAVPIADMVVSLVQPNIADATPPGPPTQTSWVRERARRLRRGYRWRSGTKGRGGVQRRVMASARIGPGTSLPAGGLHWRPV